MSNHLKELRCLKKYTAKQMSEKLGISKPFYCQLENRTRRLSYSMAIKIAAIFKMKPDAIFYEDYVEIENGKSE
ncbi:MAG: helix-turn-helix transcriptional regulator [Bacilli bacterium]|nr:helix-turn-helix transcriptional regulator [Bacilli bacterium]